LCLHPSIDVSKELCCHVVRPGVILLARYLTNQWTEFHETLVDDVVEATDEPIRFWRSRVQGQTYSKVIHLSELLWLAEASNNYFDAQAFEMDACWTDGSAYETENPKNNASDTTVGRRRCANSMQCVKQMHLYLLCRQALSTFSVLFFSCKTVAGGRYKWSVICWVKRVMAVRDVNCSRQGKLGHTQQVGGPLLFITSSVATGGHWARAYPSPSVLGHGICADPKFFLVGEGKGEMEDGLGNKPAYKSVWRLKIVFVYLYIYLASGGLVRRLSPGLRLRRWTPLVSSVPRTPVPTLTSEPGYATVHNL